MTALSNPTTQSTTELPTLTARGGRWGRWVARGLSLGLLVLILTTLGRINPTALRAVLPETLWFAPVLLALYFVVPLADWAIFRVLWRLPAAGFPILVGKRIGNELLLMYSGEAYFYLWARRRAGLTAAPFATIKDVNILSALTGNVLALGLLMLVWPVLPGLDLGAYATPLTASAVVMLAAPAAILLMNLRLFSLTRRQAALVTGIHLARLLAGVGLSALLWNVLLPEAPMTLWLAMAVVRMAIGRLPFMPNAELAFAAVAVLIMGEARDVASAVALSATAVVLLHLLFGGALSLWSFVANGRGPVWGCGRGLGAAGGWR